MERKVEVEPGYDCRLLCVHEKKGEHGINCEMWWFTACDGALAVSLSVFSGKYPDSVDTRPPFAPGTSPSGNVFSWHRADPGGSECSYVLGGRCTGGVGYPAAKTFWELHGVPDAGIEQPESFWAALEQELRDFSGREAS